MKILGFNCFGHDSAAALVIDDKVVFAVEEERLNRKKHYGDIPVNAIKECLTYANLKLSDLDHVTFSWKPSISYSKIPIYFFKYFWRVPNLIRESKQYTIEENLGMLHYLQKMKRLPQTLRELFPEDKEPFFKFHLLEHHMCHAASSFFCSPFEEAAIMTLDGAGEWTTTQLAYGKGNKIEKIATVDTPYSLGAFYQAISVYSGFTYIEGPGKLMGLASYGGDRNTDEYKKLRKLIVLKPNGGFKLDMSYFSYHYTRKSGVSNKFIEMFGPPNATKGKSWTEHEYNLANAAQLCVEDVFFHLADYLHSVTKSQNICIAGGVGLNSVANGLLIKRGPFKEMYIQPAAGDSGTSLGSALYLNNQKLGRERKFVMETAFLGPGFTEDEYEAEIKKFGFPYIKTEKYYEFAVQQLKKGRIVAWHQDRLEFGPRALGNRSILANPCMPEMKDVLNARVKFREGFRPFAAIVNEEDCGTYFDCGYPDPYMLKVYQVREEYKKLLPSITHVDGSIRIQTVNEKENPSMRKLLDEFKKETGFSVLINTSFNIKGEPIVCTAYDAVYSFDRCDMDYLVIGRFIVTKKGDENSIRNLTI
jgi:carbamoyltransferase